MMLAVTGPDRDGDLGTILAVFAHPDDEAYLAGCADGHSPDASRRWCASPRPGASSGSPTTTPLRSRSGRRCAPPRWPRASAVLGVDRAPLARSTPTAAARVGPGEGPAASCAAIIDEVQPDAVVTFEPDGQTYHGDHIAISRWTTLAVPAAAAHPAGCSTRQTAGMDRGLQASTGRPVPGDDDARGRAAHDAGRTSWRSGSVADGDLLDRKVRALECQASQVEPLVQQFGVEAFALQAADEFYRAPDRG